MAIQTNPGPKLANHRPMRQPITEAAKFQPVYNQPSVSDKKVAISVKDHDFLTLYYEKAFENIQQTNCRTLAKAYVKLVEPQKQVNYPYNGRKVIAGTKSQLDPNETKPPWWPSRVTHREPDHLPKFERIQLLVHILCELRTSHGISVAELRKADQQVRHQINPPGRLHILDELYRVRQQEEEFLNGQNDEQKMAWISHANFPGSLDAVGQTSDTINSGSLRTLFTRDIEASDHSASPWSNHAFRVKTENENIKRIKHTISPRSASEDGSPVAARSLKRKLKVAEVYSAARAKSSLLPTPYAFPPTLTDQLSLVDYYDPAFLLQPLKFPEPSHSITSIPNQSSQHQETCDIYLQNPAIDTSAQYWPTLDPTCHHNITNTSLFTPKSNNTEGGSVSQPDSEFQVSLMRKFQVVRGARYNL
ncbi:hypothetical protein N7509_013055 [Penicillium cosmopolitanum]|uniref:Subtelomeric hrmA-associated cluster protein AFUB-079030/YDR124W-like helical bundle domain-containing protein n=1 Tax=Penicillium cosmopolitanum TaxID=1131564 RepID=A0A9W9SEJ6_9EURO|nr:uncharacterized protein N7509_013055 [Penicillium cosmopolitanum]KAJ5376169.1 hypothetical protein N7509_013055 [Penicillium cosmopolitanum]